MTPAPRLCKRCGKVLQPFCMDHRTDVVKRELVASIVAAEVARQTKALRQKLLDVADLLDPTTEPHGFSTRELAAEIRTAAGE